MSQFIIPDFIKNADVNKIHKRMRDNLPNDIDKSEGSDVWNLTYPTAYEHAYFAQFCIRNALRLIWPEFSYGTYADYHGACRGMARRKAQYATGSVKIIGNIGVNIPKGTVFTTAQIADESVTEFVTTENVSIGDNQTVTVNIIAAIAGKSGNVPANTITVNSDKIVGISSLTNETATTGGYDEESDENFIERIKEYDQSQDNSFIGNDNDYRRWALEVDGVGEAVVISPEDNPNVEDDSGVVNIIIVDSNGVPADTTLCAAVYNHIMQPVPLSTDGKKTDGQTTTIERLAPPGVILEVTAPTTIAISVSGLIELDNTVGIEDIKSNFILSISEYLVQAIKDGEVRYSKIASILSNTAGVADYKNLIVNGNNTNVQLMSNQIPTISETTIKFDVGLVDG